MNKDQRAYLLKQIQDANNMRIRKLKEKIPQKPSLNNHMIAAILDGSIQMADLSKLKKKVRDTVVRMGGNEKLIITNNSKSRYFHDDDENGEIQLINLLAEDVFMLPKSYVEALNEWETIKGDIEEQIEKLEATMHTISMKINLGSPERLQKLVEQVDNMDDINIINRHLTLSSNGDAPTLPSSRATTTTRAIGSSTQKRIGNKK